MRGSNRGQSPQKLLQGYIVNVSSQNHKSCKILCKFRRSHSPDLFMKLSRSLDFTFNAQKHLADKILIFLSGKSPMRRMGRSTACKNVLTGLACDTDVV